LTQTLTFYLQFQGIKIERRGEKNEGEYAPVAYQGALLLLLRRALTHPPLHASLRQTARYQYLLIQVAFVQYLCVVDFNKSTCRQFCGSGIQWLFDPWILDTFRVCKPSLVSLAGIRQGVTGKNPEESSEHGFGVEGQLL
jgi:hypothetical protein